MMPLPGSAHGDDLRQRVAKRLETIPYARMSGMLTTAADAGGASLLLPARPDWCGDLEHRWVHTGCLCALADTACGAAVGLAGNDLVGFATLDLRMDYLRPADAGKDLFCHAHCHRLSRSVGFVMGELRQDGDEVIARVNATFMRTAHMTRRPAATTTPEALPDIPAGLGLYPGRWPYVDFLGVVAHAQTPAGRIFRLPFRPDLIGNPKLPALHGGVLAGFGETVMFLHLMPAHGGVTKSVPKAVDFAIDYMRPAKPVDTYAQGVTIRLGNRVSLVQANLWQEDPQRPVAAVRGHWLMPRPAQHSDALPPAP